MAAAALQPKHFSDGLLREAPDTVESKLSSIPDIYQMRILWVDSPLRVRPGETFSVIVHVEYAFTKPTQVIVRILDYETLSYLAYSEETLVGDGIKTFTLTLTSPNRVGVWEIVIQAGYLRDGIQVFEYLEGSTRRTLIISVVR